MIGLIVGALVGVLAVKALARRGAEPIPAAAPTPDGQLRRDCLAFIETADIGHNSLLSVAPKDLEDIELEDALHSDNPDIRKLAKAILTMASLRNGLRLTAPTGVLGSADALFELLTHAAMDGVSDRERFSAKYQEHKTALISAARKVLA